MKEVPVVSKSIPAKSRSMNYRSGDLVYRQGLSSGSIDISGKLDKSIFDSVFKLHYDDPDNADMLTSVESLVGLWTNRWMSSKGMNPGTGGGGDGGASTLGGLNNVGSWADDVPSADRIMVQLKGATHWTSKPLSEVVGLDTAALGDYLATNKYATQPWVTSQFGDYATTASLKAVSDRLDDFLTGTDTDTVINKWKELEGFLKGFKETDTLAGALALKADKTTKVIAGTGLTGGGSLASDCTLSLSASGITAGTYPKVTVDIYGRVTGYDALSVADIPDLSEKYVTTAFFSRLFKVNKADGSDIAVNDATTAIDNIEILFGLWTDRWMSSKGLNPETGGGGGATTLAELFDVQLTGISVDDMLKWNGTKWVNIPMSSIQGVSDWKDITGKPSWIGSSKPPYAFSEITSKPTTLAGYGITDGITASAAASTYVKKSGDTMTGNLNVLDTLSVGSNGVWVDKVLNLPLTGVQATANTRPRIGRFDRPEGSVVLQLGNAETFEVIDKGWTKVLFDVTKTSVNAYVPICINTGTLNGNYNEGIRITSAGNSWAGITLGSTGTSGTPTNGWFIARNPQNQLILSPGSSESNTGLTLNKGGNLLWKNNVVWHAGNDGWGSGLDADTVDGVHNGSLTASIAYGLSGYEPVLATSYEANEIKILAYNGVDNINHAIHFNWYSNYWDIGIKRGGSDNDIGFAFYRNGSEKAVIDSNGNYTGNAFSATKLQTVRYIFGQPFDGTDDIPVIAIGQMRYLSFSAYNGSNAVGYIGTGSSSDNNMYIVSYGGNAIKMGANNAYGDLTITADHKIGIGTDTPSYKLHVEGELYASSWHYSKLGYYIHGGVYYTLNSIYPDIYSSGNEICFGSTTSDLYINYRKSSGGVTVTNFRFMAGSSSNLATITCGHLNANGQIVATSLIKSVNEWFYTEGNRGWYNSTYQGGIYMNDNYWVKTYNKPLLSENHNGIGANGFNVGIKTQSAGHAGIEVSTTNGYTMGLGCHSNGSWYWWRGTANPGTPDNKSYCMNYDGTTWYFNGVLKASVGIWTDGYSSSKGLNTSDRRLKTNIRGFNATEIIRKLRPVAFEWNDIAKQNSRVFDTEDTQYGLIAQEVKDVTPWAAVDNMFGDGYMGVRYEKFIPVILKAQIEVLDCLSEEQKKIRKLERKLTNVERENKELMKFKKMVERRFSA